jgi:hypothetical protein
VIIRGFLFEKAPLDAKLSPVGVGRALGIHKDKRRVFGEEVLVLRIESDMATNVSVYRVERQAPQPKGA